MMTALTASAPLTRRLADRVHDVVDTVYAAPAPQPGHGFAPRARRAAYLLGSAVGWTVAALLVTGLLAELLR
jgi:hypothetical protein